jgi:hypothetical protein
MKNELKKAARNGFTTIMLLAVSSAVWATNSNGIKSDPSLSSLTGMEISGLVTLVLFLIVALSSKTSGKSR